MTFVAQELKMVADIRARASNMCLTRSFAFWFEFLMIPGIPTAPTNSPAAGCDVLDLSAASAFAASMSSEIAPSWGALRLCTTPGPLSSLLQVQGWSLENLWQGLRGLMVIKGLRPLPPTPGLALHLRMAPTIGVSALGAGATGADSEQRNWEKKNILPIGNEMLQWM